jgi:isoleucyl-tRNA synthetase
VVDTYRRIRNTLRFLLANVSDFDPAKRRRARRPVLEIDRYALARAAQLQADMLAHYKVYEFHPVVSKLQLYCSEDLGGFYLDVLKDRLYTTGPNSLARRSAQTALWQITQAMLRWMAPFLSFTAEEAWKVFGGYLHGNLHGLACQRGECRWLAQRRLGSAADQVATHLRQIRKVVNKEIETVRTDGRCRFVTCKPR